ncbi:MAG: YgjV family protein [Clostridia bacterium]|nr:YgjV family protein [Clostridia bacterium]
MLIISQVIGVAAVGLYLLSFQMKKRIHIVWVTCVSNALYVLQYILLGAFSGAIMDFLSTVSSFFAGKKNSFSFSKYAKVIAWLNLAAIAAVGVAVAAVRKNPVELLATAGAIFSTGGLWCDNEQTIRKFGLCSTPCWLVYNFLSQAYGASVGSVLAVVSIVTSMVRYREKKNDIC